MSRSWAYLHSEALFVDGLARRDHVSGVAIDPKEIEANAFAAQLLMPRESVICEVDSRVPQGGSINHVKLVRQLARVFQVSEQAMGLRLMNLGITTSS